MTNKEVNEFLDIEFVNRDYWQTEGTVILPVGFEHPDYISDYQPILEKLLILDKTRRKRPMLQISQYDTWEKDSEKYQATIGFGNGDWFNGFGDIIGEAICRAVVEYLKAKGGV